MVQVKVDGFVRNCPEGITWLGATNGYQYRYGDNILLVRTNGKLQEFHKYVKGGELKFITTRDKPGMTTYQRNASSIILKAFYVAVGAENTDKIVIDFSLGRGFFVGARGNFVLDETLLLRMRNKMAGYVTQRIPIMKRSVSTDDAVKLFRRRRMYDKERLFHYRRVSRVNIYGINRFEDYYYGYMVQNTGHIKCFDLVPYHYGFILAMPFKEELRIIQEFEPKDKLSATLSESTEWERHLDLEAVSALNNEIVQGEMSHLILIQEALQEKEIAEIAAQIASRRNAKPVMIVGPSFFGETTFSHRLSVQLEAVGLRPHPIAVDDHSVNRAGGPGDEQGNCSYEALECLDIELFSRNMTSLLAGKCTELPYYSFKKDVWEYKGNFLQLGVKDILVIEDIHCFNDRLSHSLPKESKLKIYISVLTQFSADEHNRIPTTDGRLIRRMVWDVGARGSSAQDTICMWPSVRRGEEEDIFPFQEEADVMFNSALACELVVLKQYMGPLLLSIPKDSEERLEAKRLSKFLGYFIGVNSEDIPKNPIFREFIGGSCLNVRWGWTSLGLCARPIQL